MSPAISSTILGDLMNVGPHISKSLSSKSSLEELHKYGQLKPWLGSAVRQLLD